MAITYKVLGQSNPSATTATTLYTAPASTQAVISTITICNQGSVAGSYRIAIRPGGASITAAHYIAYDVSLNANTSTAFTIGVTLAETDVVTVYASNGNFSFNAFGSEVN